MRTVLGVIGILTGIYMLAAGALWVLWILEEPKRNRKTGWDGEISEVTNLPLYCSWCGKKMEYEQDPNLKDTCNFCVARWRDS